MRGVEAGNIQGGDGTCSYKIPGKWLGRSLALETKAAARRGASRDFGTIPGSVCIDSGSQRPEGWPWLVHRGAHRL